MKKALSLLMLLVLVFALTGCDKAPGTGGSQEPSSSGGSTPSATGSNDVYPDDDGYATGYIGDNVHTVFFDFTINSASVCQTYEDYTPAEGNELLVVNLTVKNTETYSLPMFDTDFQAQWGDDSNDAYAFPIETMVVDDQFPSEYQLPVREERTGIYIYEVPAGHDDFSISFLEFFDDNSEGNTFFVYFTADRDNASV